MVIMEKINKKFFIDYTAKSKSKSKKIKECHKLSHVLTRVTNKPLFESLFA